MRKWIAALVVSAVAAASASAYAEAVIEEFEIEGLVTPASPKALKAGLEEKLPVEVVDINLNDTATGWPVARVRFEAGALTREQIEEAIASIEDPTGRNYRVHEGPPSINAELLPEEIEAMNRMSSDSFEVIEATNPIEPTPESIARGEESYVRHCAKCHGLSGNGHGPAAHGFATPPRPLWAWHEADASADGYLFSFITNGRTDMPPWGVVLSENERWDLVNYVKSIPPPAEN